MRNLNGRYLYAKGSCHIETTPAAARGGTPALGNSSRGLHAYVRAEGASNQRSTMCRTRLHTYARARAQPTQSPTLAKRMMPPMAVLGVDMAMLRVWSPAPDQAVAAQRPTRAQEQLGAAVTGLLI